MWMGEAKKVTPRRVAPKGKIVNSPYVRMSGYSETGASTERRALKGFPPNSGSPNSDILENLQTLRERSRMLLTSTSPATSSIRTMRTNIVGVGLIPKPSIDADALNISPESAVKFERAVAREFSLWSENRYACDALALNDFYEMQSLLLTAMLTSGDTFSILTHVNRTRMEPYSLRLHLVEADRCRTPAQNRGFTVEGKADNGNRIFDGVEVNAAGKVVAYYIANDYPYEYTKNKTEWTRIPVRGAKTGLPNILHIMNADRPDQYRGVPFLANVIEQLLQLRRYTEAELNAALVQSFFTAFITTEADPDEFMETLPEDEQAQGGISNNPAEYELGPGTVNFMRPGEGITSVQPTHPNTGFDTFMEAMCEQVGASLEIPADILMKKFGQSYSASRAELMEAWKMFSMYRRWLINDFCRPVYEVWMTEAIALGRLNAPGFFDDPIRHKAYLGCEWIGPAQGQIDPQKEINASLLAIANGLSTHEAEATRWNGSQFSVNVAKLKNENKMLADATPIQQEEYTVENEYTLDLEEEEDDE